MQRKVDETCVILENEVVGPRLALMKLESASIASAIEPGQFVHVQLPGMEGHILRRPFSVYDASEGRMDILYQSVGFGTDHMMDLVAGQSVQVMGPIGNGWVVPGICDRALAVAGGVGAAPLYMHVAKMVHAGITVDVVLGAQTKDALVTYDKYRNLLGRDPLVATDDGTFGEEGFCTGPTASLLQEYSYDHIVCCGPEALMRIVAGMAAEAECECQVSMERRMACGIGACLSCVVDTKDGKKRSCVDGPVFEASEVMW